MKSKYKIVNTFREKVEAGLALRETKTVVLFLILTLLLFAKLSYGQNYQVNGNAVNGGGGLVKLTSSTPATAGAWQTSSAWCTTKHDLSQPFDMSFDMFFGCESGANGGDGVTFTFQNQGINAIGGGGGFLGIGGGPIVSPAISIEFDTYNGTTSGGLNEIPADHIAIDINGDVNNTGNLFTGTSGVTSVQAISGGRDLESCASMANDLMTIRIKWDPATHTLQLYEDGVLTMTYTNDLVATIFGGNSSVYWGFTAATGSASNEQWIGPVGTIIPWSCTPATSCCTPFTVTPTGPTTVCSSPITLGTAASYNSYSWSTGQNSSSINISTPGTYTLNVLQNQAGQMCPGSATFVISPTGPTATLSGGATMCNDGTTTPLSVAFTGTPPWSLTYSIDGVAQPAITGINSSPYVFGGSAQHTYTLNAVTDNGGCNGVASGTATVNAYTGLPIGHDNAFTAPASTTLTVDNGGGVYDWYDGGGTLVHTGTSFNTPTLSSTTTYYVQNSALTPFVSKSVALANTSDPIAGGSAGPQATGLPKGVNWLDFKANTGFSFSRITCAINVLSSPWATSRVSVTIADITAGTSYTKDSTVTVPLTPGVHDFLLNLSYTCIAGHDYRISYEGQNSGGGLGGSIEAIMYWNLVTIMPTPYHITNHAEVDITQNSAQTQRYPGMFDWRITVGSPAFACGRTPVTAIAVIPPCYAPNSVSLTPSATTTLCEGANQTITGTADLTGLTPTNGNYYYRWYKGTTPVTAYSTVYADLSLTALTPSDAGTYTLRVEDGNAGTLATCYKEASVSIVVDAVIVPGTVATSQTICSGNTANPFTSTAAGSGGDLTVGIAYQWQSSPDGTTGWADISGATGSTYAPGAVTTTTYYRRNYTRGTFCTMASSNVISVTVNLALTAGVIASSQTICTNTTPVTLTETTAAAGGTGAYTYQWESSSNGTSGWTNASGVSGSATYSPPSLTATLYYRRVVSSGTCASKNSNVDTITVLPNVTPSVSVINSGQICVGMNATFTTTASGGGTAPNYQWYLNGNPVGANIDSYSNSSLVSGDKIHVVMTTSPVISCATSPNATSSQITMVVKPVPTPHIIGNDTTFCSGNTVLYTSTVGSGALSWNRDGVVIAGATSSSFSVGNSGVYTLTENNGACAATSAPVTVTVLPTPAADAGPDQYVEDGTTTSLHASGGSVYQWTPPTGLSDANSPTPALTPGNTITYTVKVFDATQACYNTDEVTIFVAKLIGVPNAITPNGDHNNDTWEIKNINSFPNCVVEVFNRWGTLVWKSTGYTVEWDGSNYRNGEALPDGTYFYIIDLKSKVFADPYTGYIQIVK